MRDILGRAGFVAELGSERFSFTTHEAVQQALGLPVVSDPRAVQAW